MIDPVEVVLYRDIGDNQQQVIPIEDNEDILRFFVIDRAEYIKYVFNEIEGDN